LAALDIDGSSFDHAHGMAWPTLVRALPFARVYTDTKDADGQLTMWWY
jgi:hypothetical protein